MLKSKKNYTVKNATWHNNHLKILDALIVVKGEVSTPNGKKFHSDMQMPSTKQIAEHTGLSYATVYKHLAEIGDTDNYKQHLNKFWLMSEHLLMRLFNSASYGDANSIRLYMYILSKAQDRVNKSGGCNNYIQINNLILTQENLEKLPESELKQIEEKIASLLEVSALQ